MPYLRFGTMSVPPARRRAPGWAASCATASATLRGLSTSTAGKVIMRRAPIRRAGRRARGAAAGSVAGRRGAAGSGCRTRRGWRWRWREWPGAAALPRPPWRRTDRWIVALHDARVDLRRVQRGRDPVVEQRGAEEQPAAVVDHLLHLGFGGAHVHRAFDLAFHQ